MTPEERETLEILAGRTSGVTTQTRTRDAARAALDALDAEMTDDQVLDALYVYYPEAAPVSREDLRRNPIFEQMRSALTTVRRVTR